MSHFLVIYDRTGRTETHVERVDNPGSAVTRLFEVEGALANTDQGVVLLVADSEDDLRRTHAHYFKSIDELLDLVS